MINEKQLNAIQKLGIYRKGSSVKPEPQQGDELPPALRPTMLDTPHPFEKKIDPNKVVEIVDTGVKEEKKTTLTRALPTLLVHIFLGGLLQGKMGGDQMKATLTAIATIAIPLAMLSNSNP